MFPALEVLSVFAAVAGCFMAAMRDLRESRIPNRLIGSLLIVSFFLAVARIAGGEASLVYLYPVNFIFGFLAGIVLWYIRAWSGGDAKLFWAICALIPAYPGFLRDLGDVRLPYYDNYIFGVSVLFNLALLLLFWFFFAAAYRLLKEKRFAGLLGLLAKPFIYLSASFLFTIGLSYALCLPYLAYLAVPLAMAFSLFEGVSLRLTLLCAGLLIVVGLNSLHVYGIDPLMNVFAAEKSVYALTFVFSAYAVGSRTPLSLYVAIRETKTGMTLAEEVHLHGGRVERRPVENSVWGRIKTHVNKKKDHSLLIGPRPEGLSERDIKELKKHERALKGVVKINLGFPLTPYLFIALLVSLSADYMWLILR